MLSILGVSAHWEAILGLLEGYLEYVALAAGGGLSRLFVGGCLEYIGGASIGYIIGNNVLCFPPVY